MPLMLPPNGQCFSDMFRARNPGKHETMTEPKKNRRKQNIQSEPKNAADRIQENMDAAQDEHPLIRLHHGSLTVKPIGAHPKSQDHICRTR